MQRSARRLGNGVAAAAAAVTLVLGLAVNAGASPAAPVARAAPAARATPAARSVPGPQYVPPGRPLRLGDHGAAVRSLQRRLAQLKYYPGPIDGKFGSDTREAVWAFEEVQGIGVTAANSAEIGRKAEHALVHPKLPWVLRRRGGSQRIEVNQRIEVLVLYRRNKVELISHVSTGAGCLPGQGCGWITPDGAYRAEAYLPGWVTVPLGVMYNPVFFIGRTFAIHGETNANVPYYPDSHGCVRIPYDIAVFFHKRVRISATDGTPVYIVGRAPGT